MPSNLSLNYTEYAISMRDKAVEQLTMGTKTSMLGDQSLIRKYGSDLTNHREIKLSNMDYSKAGLLDYEGYYPDVEVDLEWVTRSLRYDRAMKLVFDKLDAKEVDGGQGNLTLSSIMGKLNKMKVMPELEATNMEIAFEVAQANTLAASPTASTVVKDIRQALSDLEDMGIELSQLQIFTSTLIRDMMVENLEGKSNLYNASMDFVNANGVAYKLPSIQGVGIQVMPQNRFYTKIQRFTKADQTVNPLNVGYTKATGASDIAWLIVPRDYVLPIVKLSDLKISMDSITNTTDRNNKAAYNVFYDCLIEENFKPYFRGALMSGTVKASASGSAPVASLNDTETKSTK